MTFGWAGQVEEENAFHAVGKHLEQPARQTLLAVLFVDEKIVTFHHAYWTTHTPHCSLQQRSQALPIHWPGPVQTEVVAKSIKGVEANPLRCHVAE